MVKVQVTMRKSEQKCGVKKNFPDHQNFQSLVVSPSTTQYNSDCQKVNTQLLISPLHSLTYIHTNTCDIPYVPPRQTLFDLIELPHTHERPPLTLNRRKNKGPKEDIIRGEDQAKKLHHHPQKKRLLQGESNSKKSLQYCAFHSLPNRVEWRSPLALGQNDTHPIEQYQNTPYMVSTIIIITSFNVQLDEIIQLYITQLHSDTSNLFRTLTTTHNNNPPTTHQKTKQKKNRKINRNKKQKNQHKSTKNYTTTRTSR
jgi:hypothetical protein